MTNFHEPTNTCSYISSFILGFHSSHPSKTGSTNSLTTLPVWRKTSNVATSDVDNPNFYDENQLPHGGPSDDRKRRDVDDEVRYDRENPSVGVKQITTGFSKCATRYLSACSGQKNYNYQVNRMEKWNNKLQAHLANNQNNNDNDEEEEDGY